LASEADIHQRPKDSEDYSEHDPNAAVKERLHCMEFQQPAGFFNEEKDKTQNNPEAATNHRQITNHRCDIRVHSNAGLATRSFRRRGSWRWWWRRVWRRHGSILLLRALHAYQNGANTMISATVNATFAVLSCVLL